MEEIYACLAYEPCLFDNIDIKTITGPIWLLGKKYCIHAGDDFEDLNDDIKNKLWFTYRKQFQPIGETSLTSDAGWGCMHRCGQMVLAQALMLQQFGREWKWRADEVEEMYLKILSKFDDKPECQYSIHKIATMGSILEKQIGQWFGPNTVVQVLKKLVEEDSEVDITIHVAMDNMVIKSEIRRLFAINEASSSEDSSSSSKVMPSLSNHQSEKADRAFVGNGLSKAEHPVLITIPLRLGLYEILPAYFEKLKAVFTLKQSLGIIGGRTNHASYFIGYVGNELIYLDPHTTQMHRSEGPMEDSTYHCEHPSRMAFSQLEPSIALCFYLENVADFEQWCQDAQKTLLEPEKDAIFEILEDKPAMLPYVDIDDSDDCVVSLPDVDRIFTSDDEFEFLM